MGIWWVGVRSVRTVVQYVRYGRMSRSTCERYPPQGECGWVVGSGWVVGIRLLPTHYPPIAQRMWVSTQALLPSEIFTWVLPTTYLLTAILDGYKALIASRCDDTESSLTPSFFIYFASIGPSAHRLHLKNQRNNERRRGRREEGVSCMTLGTIVL